jgi:hypothetical protein
MEKRLTTGKVTAGLIELDVEYVNKDSSMGPP